MSTGDAELAAAVRGPSSGSPRPADPVDIMLITATDCQGGRDAELLRLLASIEQFRANRPRARIRMRMLLQRCADASRVQAIVPDWVDAMVRVDQLSLSSARNAMLDEVMKNGQIGPDTMVAFPDDDAWYPQGTFEAIHDAFLTNRATDFWFCKYGVHACYRHNAPHQAPSLQQVLSFASSNTIVLRGRVLHAIGGFDEGLGLGTLGVGGEDTEFALRAYVAARRSVFVPATMVGHRDPNRALRATYYMGSLAAIRRHAYRSAAGRWALLRKLAVGFGFTLTGRLTPGGFAKALAFARNNRREFADQTRASSHRPSVIRTFSQPRRAVIIVENLPLPFDRRVWQEAQALVDRGWKVSAICPRTEKYPLKFEEIDGVAIYRHPLPLEARGAIHFLLEYASALFHQFRLLLKIAFTRGFDVVQACNPPDLIFLVAAPFRLFGKKFVFDHHDSSPALYLAKFGRRDIMYRMLLLAEKLTFKTANRIVSANESYREEAIRRGGRKPDDVTAVYSVPDTSRIRAFVPDPKLRDGAKLLLGYVGIIGDQDGVDHLVRMMRHLVDEGAGEGVRAIVVGDGPALQSVRELAHELGVGDRIVFTGYLSGEKLLAALNSFDIGIIPDPVNPYNDRISMNKVFEYSTLGIPSVSYDLSETRRLLGAAGSYAIGEGPQGLANACRALIDDPVLRKRKAEAAKRRADERFHWEQEAERYLSVYEDLVPNSATR